MSMYESEIPKEPPPAGRPAAGRASGAATGGRGPGVRGALKCLRLASSTDRMPARVWRESHAPQRQTAGRLPLPRTMLPDGRDCATPWGAARRAGRSASLAQWASHAGGMSAVLCPRRCSASLVAYG